MNVDLATESSVAAPSGGQPLLPDVGVLALVPERWGGMWLSRHQISTRLSRYFHVVWQNPARSWRGGARVLNHADPTPPPARGFSVYDPGAWLPRFYRPRMLDHATERARLGRARHILERAGCRRVIAYLWLPEYARDLDFVKHDASCYHIADEYSFQNTEHAIPSDELALIERVDQVFIHSPALMEKKGHINPHTAYVTNGVDYAAFAGAPAEPADLAAIPHPRVGYVGRIKSQMDWNTLLAVARQRPEWSLVLVGPVGHMGEFESMRREVFALPNVHYLGNRSVRDVPAYVHHMDVCLLCYALNDYTRYIFPLKLHEYLAAGRPVVGSDIRTLRDFAGTIRIAHTPDEWIASIEASLSVEERSAERVEARRRVARQFDWNQITERIAGILCERLGGDMPSRFAGVTARKA